MRLAIAIAFVLAVSAILAGAGAYVGSHPQLLTTPTGIAAFDDTGHIAARFFHSSSALIALSAESGTMLDAAQLEALAALSRRLKNSGACTGVLSIAALPNIVSDADGTEIRDMIEAVPRDAAEDAALRARIKAYPHAIGELISADLRETLVICTLSATASIDVLDPIIHDGNAPFSARFVGPLGLGSALADDLIASAIYFVVLGLVIAIVQRKVNIKHPGMVLFAASIQAALIYLVQPVLWHTPHSGLAGMLGPSVASAQRSLDHITHAETSVLVEVSGEFTLASEVKKLQAFCNALVDHKLRVACPNDLLRTMSQALAGTDALPASDAQMQALWFFGGDRAELALVFTRDRKAALLRVQAPRGSDLSVLDAQLKEASQGLSYRHGGLPYIERALARSRIALFALVAALAALALVVGRVTGFDAFTLGEATLAPALLIKVGIVSRIVLTLGLILLFASVGAKTRDRLEKSASRS